MGAGWFPPASLIAFIQSKCSTNIRFGHGVGGLGRQIEKAGYFCCLENTNCIGGGGGISLKWTEGGPADCNYIYPGLPCPLLDGVWLCSRLWALLERGSHPRGLGPALERVLFWLHSPVPKVAVPMPSPGRGRQTTTFGRWSDR